MTPQENYYEYIGNKIHNINPETNKSKCGIDATKTKSIESHIIKGYISLCADTCKRCFN